MDGGVVIPKWNEMFGPTVEALRELGGSGTIQEISATVIEQQGYCDEQLAVMHGDSDKTEIEYRLAWARTNLKNLNAVTNSSRGV
jgi:restriction system protein